MEILSQQESNRLRLNRLVAIVFRVDFGTLWWVPDRLWSREMSTFRPRPDGRHPGLCIRPAGPPCIFDPWPLLLGHSESGPLAFVGLNAQDPQKVGYFGKVLRPGMFGAAEFAPVRGGERDGYIRRNRFKPSLTEDEESRLREFLQNKGLLGEP